MLDKEQIEGWEDISWPKYKHANELYWAVKGQLIPLSWSTKDINATYDSYIKRLWGNHEAMTSCHMKGFEKAWEERVEYCSGECWDGDTFEQEEEDYPDFVNHDMFY